MSYSAELDIINVTDTAQFKALAGGKVWFGVPDGSPATVAGDRIQVYLARQGLADLAIAQPLDIGPGGQVMYSGQPAQIKVLVPYCVQVMNSLGVQRYYAPKSNGYIEKFIEIDTALNYLVSAVITVEKYSDISAALLEMSIGDQFILSGHTVAGKGGGIFNVVSSSGRTANNGTCVINGALAAVRHSNGGRGFSVYDFGALCDGVTDDSAAFNYANASGEIVTAPVGDILIANPVTLRQFVGSGRYVNQTKIILTGAGQLKVGDAYSSWRGFRVTTAVNNKTMIKNEGHSYFTCKDFLLFNSSGTGQCGIEFDLATADIYFNVIDDFSIDCDYPVKITGDLSGGSVRAFNSNVIGRGVAGNKWFRFESAITVDMGTGVCDANEFGGYFETGTNVITLISGSVTPFKQNRIKVIQDAVTRIWNSAILITNQNIWEVLDVGPFTWAGVLPQNQIIIGPPRTTIRATDTASTPTITTGTEVTMVFDSETYDLLGEFNSATGVFSPLYTGYYQVDCGAITQAYTWPLASKFEMRMYKNGTVYSSDKEVSQTAAAATIPFSCKISALVFLTGMTDTLSIKLTHNRLADTLLDSSPTFNYINISRAV